MDKAEGDDFIITNYHVVYDASRNITHIIKYIFVFINFSSDAKWAQ